MSTPPDTPSAPSAGRRTLLALVSLGAAAGGVWWAWRHEVATRTVPAPTPTPGEINASATPAPAAADALPANFWQQQFDTPSGTPLAWAELKGHPVLLNFWASWCPPCLKEMPELDRFHHDFGPKGWKVVGLAIDSPTPVREYLAKTGVAFPIGLAGLGGTELAQALGNAQGGLPFSVLIGSDGRIHQRKLGATSYDELAGWAKAIS